jgi:hypothetical protein
MLRILVLASGKQSAYGGAAVVKAAEKGDSRPSRNPVELWIAHNESWTTCRQKGNTQTVTGHHRSSHGVRISRCEHSHRCDNLSFLLSIA